MAYKLGEELEAAVAGGLEISDSFGVVLGNNERCIFNFQCGGDLVCRPSERATDICDHLLCRLDQFCLEPGDCTSDLCDSSADCTEDRVCVGETLTEPGYCGYPHYE